MDSINIISVFIAAMAAVFILIFMMFIQGIKSSNKKFMRMQVESAEAEGRTVTAHLVRIHSVSAYMAKDYQAQKDRAVYKYEYNGKQYTYANSFIDPPSTLTLYFVKDPRKAAIETDFYFKSIPWLRRYLVIFAVSFLLVSIFK